MDITKSHWVTDADNMRLTMPFAKVDVEQRLVSGYATLDNLDKHGDIVLAEASQKAFSRFRGNIREMHQPIAAGRLVDFREDEFYDQETEKFYRGVFVTAYVSKGANDTWEKVLDGTLTGFSIGGAIKEQETEWVKDAGAAVRFIKDYELVELSLVDNPANNLANVFSITKSAEGSVTMKGMIADTVVENVFWCANDGIAKQTRSESANCSLCRKDMQNIGWFEQGDSITKMQEVVNKFLGTTEEGTLLQKQAPTNSEGGVDVADNNEEVADDRGPTNGEVTPGVNQEEGAVQEGDNTNEEVAAGEAVEGEPEGAVPVDEVAPSDPELNKALDDLKNSFNSGLEETRKALGETVKGIEAKVEELNKSFETKASELETKVNELSTGLADQKENTAKFAKALEALESETAIRKSGDVESTDTVQKSTDAGNWNGSFLGLDRL